MNHILSYSLYIFFGIIPSILWLQYYLRKDVKPEPKLMIIKVFFYGALFTIPAIFLEIAAFEGIKWLGFSSPLLFILNIFLGVALVEEFLKFLVVKTKVLNNPEFDEPIDAMIYMIIAALGFAASENILTLISAGNQSLVVGGLLFPLNSAFFGEIFEISLLRFLGATFLHALSSATIGFFIGLSFFEKEKRNKLILIGLTLAVLLHGFYNFSIMKIGGNLKLLIPFVLLIISAILISFGFKHLRKMAEVRKISN
ncbi:MAG: PrsW family intramembrane metalloprotease [Patescibacteria group bacterium]|nr:PrsW family intramembrane metalloprotease [Patescibacteria group bacterium]